MLGLTDLDIVVDRRQATQLQELLSRARFKRFGALGAGAYPAVEDYLGFDEASGKLVHLHLHYELVLGEKHLKGYRLPWEDELLHSRIFDEARIYMADPNLELLLLLVRSALKLRLRDKLKERGKPYLGRDSTREYNWLQARTDPQKVEALTRKLLGDEAAKASEPLLTSLPTLDTLTDFARAAVPTLELYRSYAPLGARVRRLFREGLWVMSVLNKRYVHAPTPLRRTVPTGGRIVAFLGSDGSGKSTLLKSVNRWLSWKLDVYPVYHGSGDGSASLLRLPLRWGLRLLKRRKRYPPPTASTAAGLPKPKQLTPARVLWALVLAQEKRTKLKNAWRARHAGMVVLADRYPQTSVPGFNDGPLLSPWLSHSSALRRRLAEWERQPYDWAMRYPPDLVVKLHVSPEVAHGRKPEMPLESFYQRVAAVENMTFDTEVVVIDADQTADEILAEVKQLVWELL